MSFSINVLSCRPIGKPGLLLAIGAEISLFSARPSV